MQVTFSGFQRCTILAADGCQSLYDELEGLHKLDECQIWVGANSYGVNDFEGSRLIIGWTMVKNCGCDGLVVDYEN